MIFKINIVNLTDKYPRLIKSSVILGFLKNYYKDMKEIRDKNSTEFKGLYIKYMGGGAEGTFLRIFDGLQKIFLYTFPIF